MLKLVTDALSSTLHRDTITTPLAESAVPAHREALALYPFTLDDYGTRFLQKKGITVPGTAFQAHPHPIHKTHELYTIKKEWRHLATSPSTVMYMKEEKFNAIQRLNPNFQTLFNQIHTPKDEHRYRETSIGPIETPMAFMHDALMYITPGQVLEIFRKSPKLNRLYATLVLPAEYAEGLPSFNPGLYDFSVRDDRLLYTLEGSTDGAYDQPLSAIVWLKIHEITGAGLKLSVALLNTFGPFHTVLISRAQAKQEIRRFYTPESYLLPEPCGVEVAKKTRLVPKDVYDGLFTYARAVRTLRLTDPAGYVRTQKSKEEYKWVQSSAWDYLVNFVNKTAMYRPQHDFPLANSIWERLGLWIQHHEWALTSISTFLSTGALSRLIFWSDVNRVSHLRIFGRVILNSSTNPLLVWRRNWPRWITGDSNFSINSEARFEPLDLLKQHLPKFVTSRFPKWRPRPHLKPPLAWVVFGLGAAAAFWLATRVYNSQCRSDLYLSYLHCKRFHVEWQTISINAEPEKFFLLPIRQEKKAIEDKPDSGYDGEEEEDDEEEVATPVASEVDSPPLVKRTPVASKEPSSAEWTPSPVPSIEQPKERSPELIKPNSLDSPAPFDIHTPPETFMEPLLERLDKIAAEREKAEQAEKWTPGELTQMEVAEDGTEVCSSTTLNPNATVYEPKPPPPLNKNPERRSNPLLDDPTASGPVKQAREFFQFPANEGVFLMRRAGPRKETPPMISTNCLLTALAPQLQTTTDKLWLTLSNVLPDSMISGPAEKKFGLSTDHLELLCSLLHFQALVKSEYGSHKVGEDGTKVWLLHTPGHWSAPKKFDCFPDPLPESSWLMEFLTQNPQIPTRAVHRYTFDRDRAKNLASNIKNGQDGVLGTLAKSANFQIEQIDHWPTMVANAAPRTTDFTVVLGFPGCGKSKPVQDALRKRINREYVVVTPSAVLREDWKKALDINASESWRVSTWETALLRLAPVVIIDEVFLLPNGYIDLVMALNPNIKALIVLGDPLQNGYHSVRPDSTNCRLLTEREHLRPFFDIYSAYTHRLPKTIAKCLGVYTTSKRVGDVSAGDNPLPNRPNLVPSRQTADLMNANGRLAFTAAGSQGLTFEQRVNIYLDSNWPKCSKSVSLVAATRSRQGVHFVKGTGLPSNALISDHPAFEAIFNSQCIDYVQSQIDELGGCKILRRPEDVAKLGPHRFAQLKLVGAAPSSYEHFGSNNRRFHRMTDFKFDPYHPRKPRDPAGPQIKSDYIGDVVLNLEVVDTQPQIIPSLETTHVPETRRPMHIDIACALPEPVVFTEVPELAAPCEPVYPGYNYELLLPELTRPEAPTDLEITYRGETSNQFPTIDKEFELGAETLEVIAPNHNSKKDPTLLPASIEKRLRFRRSGEPPTPSARDCMAAELLYSSYCDALHIDPYYQIPFDEQAFIDCIHENEYSQLSSKSKAVIQANWNRSDPDWRYTYVRIFAKTQHKINDASIFGEWKACQTLALMNDFMVLTFGPVKKYQRLMLERHGYNPKVFVYAGKSPTQLSSFVKQHFPKNTHRCWNDFTAFDQSQGLETTLFEAKKMWRVSIPKKLVALHVFIKTRIDCQFGPLTSMRLTGEPGTYDDNTDYNIAISNLRFNIHHSGGLFSGDDSAFPTRLTERASWPMNSQYFSRLQFKTVIGQYATFCGYYVGSEGAVRCPKPLVTKLVIAKDNGSLKDKLASYVAEFAVGHSLGDDMWKLLPIEEVPYQSGTFDFICRHAPREMKVALNIGAMPEDVIAAWPYTLTRPIFAMLNRSQRIQYLKSKASRFASWASSFMPPPL